MNIRRSTLLPGLFAIATLLAITATAQADTINGSAWFVPEAAAQNAILANVPGTTPNATFTANALNFNSNVSGYTLGAFLTGGGATILTGSASDLGTVLDNGVTGTIFDLTGTLALTNGVTYFLTHDDGVSLFINGALVSGLTSGPTAPVAESFVWSGATGDYSAQLIYGECCGAPAVLQSSNLNFVAPVPEPGTLTLLGTGLLGLAGVLRRKLLGS